MRARLPEFLKSKGFKHRGKYADTGDVFKKDVDGIEFIYLLIYPHEGTNNRIMLRADAVENHDRWANSDFKRYYKDENDFMQNWNKYIFFDYENCN